MNSYFTKMMLFYAGVYSMVNFGWIVSTFYLMSNSSEQTRYFSLQGFVAWLCCFLAGCILMAIATRPVSAGLKRMASGCLDDSELPAVTRRNSILPVLGGCIVVFMTTVFDIALYVSYTATDIGKIASTGIWATNIAADGVFFIIMYGSCSLVANRTIGVLKKECRKRNIAYEGYGISLQVKLWLLLTLLLTSTTAWLMMLGFYEGIYRIQEDFQEDLIASQKAVVQSVLQNREADLDLESLKIVADRLESTGVGRAFLADRAGDIVYNPGNVTVYNSTWKDIDKTIRDALRQGRDLSIYENINEQVIACVPVNDRFSIGVVRAMKDKLGNFKQFWIISLLLIIVGIAILCIAGITLVRSISIPVKKTVEKLKDISEGEGDLRKRLEVRSNDETGTLAEEFNVFMDNLEKMITDMKNIASALDTGTGEVAAGAQSLSEGTQNQASAIEEVAATIEQIASSIKNNAANASDSRDKVRNMVDLASVAGQVSRELVQSMSEISDASKQVGTIIDAVNQVAFQTNLLALNASVEAARAGEHGRGFAVVAGEVRTLAQSSAESAKRIRDLVEDTIRKVSAGDEKVRKTEESLNQIISLIQGLFQTIEEIAEASTEQATGIDELNRTIAQIDQSTQGIAVTTEELAATSDNLNNKSGQLSKHVSRFKISRAGEYR